MNYTVSESVLNEVLKYLGNRPYVETANLIDLIRKGVTPVTEASDDDQANAPQAPAANN